MKHFLVLITAAFTIAASADSHAIRGDGGYHHMDQARQHRVHDAGVQQRLTRSPAFQDFLQRRGGQWQALWDEVTHTPAQLLGSGWPVDPARLSDDKEVWQLGREILVSEHQLLGGRDISLDDLSPWVLDRSRGITTLTFKRLWHGLEVIDARVSLRFKADRFLMAQFESMPGISMNTSPGITPAAALKVALQNLDPNQEANFLADKGELVVLPLFGSGARTYRLAWRFQLRGQAKVSSPEVYIDAHSAEFLGWKERIRFVSGEIQGEHDDRRPGPDLVRSPMVFAELSGGGLSATADSEGVFSVDAEAPVQLRWSAGSQWFDIRALDDRGLSQFIDELDADAATLVAQANEEDLSNRNYRRELAQIDAHISAHEVRARGLKIRSSFPWADERVITRVNDGSSRCNAWFDEESTINFVVQGQGCNNTARVADVIYHEYGHGFHLWNIIQGAGGFGDGSISEGLADYMSATITDSSDLAPGFFLQSNQPLRQLDGEYRWPEDIEEDPHSTGLIIGSALWHLRQGLIETYGYADGVELADSFFLAAARRAAEIPLVYGELLLEDDDDGDLSNGSPNRCLIDEVFERHGLAWSGDSPGSSALQHTPLTSQTEPDGKLTVEVASELSNLNCDNDQVTRLVLSWSYGEDGEWASEDMSEGQENGSYVGTIPAAPAASYVRYYIEAEGEDGEVIAKLPEGSISDPWFGVWIGATNSLFFEDFEERDGDFTHLLISGAEQLGADDWQWGEPQGEEGDPDYAFSGDQVWGNDLAIDDNWNGAYQADVHNRLTSPVIELPEREQGDRVMLQFRRWLNVEDGYYDQAQVLVNNTLVWSQFASSEADGADRHHKDLHWAFRSYDITEIVADDNRAEIAWEIISDGGLELGGWNIDDVGVVLVPAASTQGDDDSQNDQSPGGDGALISASGCTCSTGPSSSPDALSLLLATTTLLFAGARRRRP